MIFDVGTFSMLELAPAVKHNLTDSSGLNGLTWRVAWAGLADTSGGIILLWHYSTASISLDSITSLTVLRNAIKNKLLSTAENWGINALTLIICSLSQSFRSNNLWSNIILLISVPRSCLCCNVPCGYRSIAVNAQATRPH